MTANKATVASYTTVRMTEENDVVVAEGALQRTVARVKRRQPGWTMAVVTAIPVPDPAVAPIVTQSGRADYVFFTRCAPNP